MNVFELQRKLIADYASYVKSFIAIRDARINEKVAEDLDGGLLWPEPRLGLNPSYAEGGWIDSLVAEGLLHPDCAHVFRANKAEPGASRGLRLHRHQREAIEAARRGVHYVLTTGTGSGKSLAYIVPIVDHVLRSERRPGIKAIVVYPMNALANSQAEELKKFLSHGYPDGRGPVTFQRYTGQESEDEKHQIILNPPDILLTNYVMLELILTRSAETALVKAAEGLQFLVLDELHTYRGRQGADVALLVRRTREACRAEQLQCVGTSATMASAGGLDEQRAAVARVASLIFGQAVEPTNVIGETLQRSAPEPASIDRFDERLAARVADRSATPPADYEAFLADPLSAWIESAFGTTRDEASGQLVRVRPRPIAGPDGAARELAAETHVDEPACIAAIQQQLLAGAQLRHPQTGFPAFAFRLHQFISRGDAAYASMEPEDRRYITVHPQQFVPGDRGRHLLPLVFCRDCGQEYYAVRQVDVDGELQLVARDPGEKADGDGKVGYLHLSVEQPWPADALQRGLYPEDWLEPTGLRLKPSARHLQPKRLDVHPDGRVGPGGVVAHFVPAPFRLCLNCLVSYRAHTRSDFAKLGTLGSEGRSTATTILSLATIRHLRAHGELDEEARKLLSFTDNRQDASLQAGHFNDFVQVGLLRSGLYRAASAAGPEGLAHDELTQKVATALDLENRRELWALNPGAMFLPAQEALKALRQVIGYRLYLDQRRGWRITSPNLEQTGLIRIEYATLPDICAHQPLWAGRHDALAIASPATREAVCRTLLDLMRRELAIKVDFLDANYQERIAQASSQHLREPWALDENEAERLEHASVLLPRSQREGDWRGHYFLSPRGGFGQYLKRVSTFPHTTGLDTQALAQIARDLLDALTEAGLVQRVREPDPRISDDVPGYQLLAAGMRWVAGDGTSAAIDPIRVPRPPAEGSRPNAFFLDFYRNVAGEGHGVEAREHTAQVPYEMREEREQRFRKGALPVLFCSPTMELGVDIAQLNVVSLRNVPPTPANYAQRSGRAGRGGQPALVFTYCSTGSPHDQYFFRRPVLMVSGQVAPPRLDLVNEDLIRAHVHAVWLSTSGLSLGRSLGDILDLGGSPRPTLELKESVRQDVEAADPRQRALERARRVLGDLAGELDEAPWWSERWLEGVMHQTGREFDKACGRWRSLYRAAFAQAEAQQAVILDHSRTEDDRRAARKLRAEAEAQLALLRAEGGTSSQSDFYSYRYFASEGFLPGYSFPRLPLSAFIPGRRGARGSDEFLSRPRFLAISEFGPQNFIYHEGSRYIINRVILPVTGWDDVGAEREPITSTAKHCGACGYLHPVRGGSSADLCESCGATLGTSETLTQLFRLENVVTKRRDRINSDEEERQRHGYQVQSAIRFADVAGEVVKQVAMVEKDGALLATLTYGHAATIRRINLGWRRRRSDSPPGFVLDMERGYWSKEGSPVADDANDEPMTPRRERVIPYVEDRRNALVIQPGGMVSLGVMASLQAALKSAIQVVFQLEDSELAAEPLPDAATRSYLLLYEAAEGGAGVLRRLVDDPAALPLVARAALEICHFDPDTGDDRGSAPGAKEQCEAACYDCLMSYSNQPDHPHLDRKPLAEVLMALAGATVACAPGPVSRAAHYARLSRLVGSQLEQRWLELVMRENLRLPTDAQKVVLSNRPDFLYDIPGCRIAVYIDGPVHDFPDRQERDRAHEQKLLDKGWEILRFRHDDDWPALLEGHPSIFGPGNRRPA